MTAMEAKSATVRAFPPKEKEKRPYGKAPFEFGLDLAVEAVNKFAQEGKSLPESTVAVILGNTVTSSSFTRKLRALTSYGLIVEQPGAQFALTDLALAIALPRSSQAQAEAKKLAFLKIEQFSMLFNQHKGKLLPADEFLRNILEQECNIPRESSQVWVKHFKDGARTVGLLYRRGDGKIQITESPILPGDSIALDDDEPSEKADSTPKTTSDDNEQPAAAVVEASRAAVMPVQSQEMRTAGHYTRIDLSDGRRAEIIIPDGLTSKDAKKLKRALEGIAVIIESMILEGE
jgi:hypothetical protein